ncbi:hypothetical protein V6N12_017896 [Hibiscus sabdariffa]
MAARFTEVEFVKLDVDEMHDVAQEYGVQAMPTFVLLKKGKEVDRVVGSKRMILRRRSKNIRLCKLLLEFSVCIFSSINNVEWDFPGCDYKTMFQTLCCGKMIDDCQ